MTSARFRIHTWSRINSHCGLGLKIFTFVSFLSRYSNFSAISILWRDPRGYKIWRILCSDRLPKSAKWIVFNSLLHPAKKGKKEDCSRLNNSYNAITRQSRFVTVTEQSGLPGGFGYNCVKDTSSVKTK